MLQLVVTVYDDAIPEVRATSTLTVSVARNQFSPRFTQNPYTATINSLTQVGSVVATVAATDDDNVRF